MAALFAALAAGGHALGAALTHRRAGPALPGLVTAAAALVPVLALAVAFPEGGTEPFALGTLLPLLAICALALLALPRDAVTLRAGIALYLLAMLAVYAVPSPIGSNIARLGTLLAAPMAALLWRPRRRIWLALCALPLLYVGWQAPVADVAALAGDPATSAAYYRPLERFLEAQPGGRERAFRIEIPFTNSHWEAYRLAPRFPLARGWERQLDRADNALFYDGRLTADALRPVAARQRDPLRRPPGRLAGPVRASGGGAHPRRAALPAAGHALGPLAGLCRGRSHTPRAGGGDAARHGL